MLISIWFTGTCYGWRSYNFKTFSGKWLLMHEWIRSKYSRHRKYKSYHFYTHVYNKLEMTMTERKLKEMEYQTEVFIIPSSANEWFCFLHSQLSNVNKRCSASQMSKYHLDLANLLLNFWHSAGILRVFFAFQPTH